eukprot:m51a1_g9356 hypothetical protein (3176) ;mRNA; r:135916-146439
MGWVESVAVWVVQRYLGDFVAAVGAEQLSVSLRHGDAHAKDLALRPDALDRVTSLPFAIKRGCVRELRMKVPWHSLGSQAVVVELDGLYAVAAPRERTAADTAATPEARHADKMRQLALYELVSGTPRDLRGEGVEQAGQQQGYSGRLMATAIANVIVRVRDVHVRFEDAASDGSRYAVGVTLSSAGLETTDAEWRPAFVDQHHETTFKLLTLGSLGVYWDASSEPVPTDDLAAFKSAMQSLIAPEGHSYVLRPVSLEGRVTLNDGTGSPKRHVSVSMGSADLVVEREQYCQVLELISALHSYQRSLRLESGSSAPRPSAPHVSGARQWIAWAGQRVLEQVRENRARRSWTFISKRRDYMRAYGRKLLGKATAADLKAMDAAEHEFSLDDLYCMRAYAVVRAKSSRAAAAAQTPVPAATPTPAPAAAPTPAPAASPAPSSSPAPSTAPPAAPEAAKGKGGWMSWFWGSKTTEGALQALPKEEQAEVVKLMDESTETVASPSAVVTSVSVSLSSASLTLGSVFSSSISGVGIELDSRALSGSWVTRLHVSDMVVDSAATGVRVMSFGPHGDGERIMELTLDSRPPDNPDADYSVYMRTMPAKLAVTSATLVAVCSFFRPPDALDVSYLAGDINSYVSDISEKQLRAAARNKAAIGVDVVCESPEIMIPAPDSSSLVLTPGRMSIRSQLPRRDSHDVSAYTRYLVAFENVSAELVREGRSERLLFPCSADISVSALVLPANTRWEKLLVEAELPDISVVLSDQRLDSLRAVWSAQSTPISAFFGVESTQHPPQSVVVRKLLDGKERDSNKWVKAKFLLRALTVDAVSASGAKTASLRLEGAGATYEAFGSETRAEVSLHSLELTDDDEHGAEKLVHCPRGDRLLHIEAHTHPSRPPAYSVAGGFVELRPRSRVLFNLMRMLRIGTDVDEVADTDYQPRSRRIINIAVSGAKLVLRDDSPDCARFAVGTEEEHALEAPRLATVEVGALSATLDMRRHTERCTGELMGVRVTDDTAQTAHDEYRRAIDGIEAVKFRYSSFSTKETSVVHPGYGSRLEIDAQTVHAVYLHRFWMTLFSWIGAFNRGRGSLRASSCSPAAPAGATDEFTYVVQAAHPEIVVPRSSTSGTTFTAVLSPVTVSNSYFDSGATEVVSFALPGFRIVHAADSVIVPACSGSVNYTRTREGSEVAARFADAELMLTARQYNAVLGIVYENFREYRDDSPALLLSRYGVAFDGEVALTLLADDGQGISRMHLQQLSWMLESRPEGSRNVIDMKSITGDDLTAKYRGDLSRLIESDVSDTPALVYERTTGADGEQSTSVTLHSVVVSANQDTYVSIVKFGTLDAETSASMFGQQQQQQVPRCQYRLAVDSVTLLLNTDGKQFSSVMLSNAESTLAWDAAQNVSTLTFQTKDLQVLDLEKSSPVVSFPAGDVVNLEARYVPDQSAYVKARCHSLHYSFAPGWLTRMRAYAAELSLLSRTLRATAAEVVKRSPTVVTLDVVVECPEVVLRLPSDAKKSCVVRLGVLSVSSEPSGMEHRCALGGVCIGVEDAPGARVRNLLSDIALDVRVRVLDAMTTVCAALPLLEAGLSRDDFLFLRDINRMVQRSQFPSEERQDAQLPQGAAPTRRLESEFRIGKCALHLAGVASVICSDLRYAYASEGGATETSITLSSVRVDDDRPGRSVLYSMLAQTLPCDQPTLSFASAVRPGGSSVSVRVLKPRGYVIPGLISQLGEFFADNEPAAEHPLATPQPSDAQGAEQKQEPCEVSVDIVDPEFSIMEDLAKPDTRMIALKFECSLRSSVVEDSTSAKCDVSRLVLFSCVAGHADATTRHILAPCNVGVSATLNRRTGVSVQVDIDDLEVTSGYNDAKLVLVTFNSLLPKQVDRVLSEFKPKFAFEIVRLKEKTAEEEVEPASINSAPIYDCQLRVPVAAVSLVNDLEGESRPFISLVTRHVCVLTGMRREEAFVDLSLSAECRAFSEAVSAWEPLVEEWECTVHAERKSSKKVLLLEAAAPLRINITPSFVTSLTAISWTWLNDYSAYMRTNDGKLHRQEFFPYRIRNRSGGPLNFSPTHGGQYVELRDGEELALKDVPCVDGEVVCSLRLDADDTEREWPPNRIGSYHSGSRLVVDVALERGCKVSTIHSFLSVENRAAHDVEMLVVRQSTRVVTRVPQGERAYVPVAVAMHRAFRMHVRPAGWEDAWSMPEYLWPAESIVTPACCEYLRRSADSSVWYALTLQEVPEGEVSQTVVLSSQLELVNALKCSLGYELKTEDGCNTTFSGILSSGQLIPVHGVSAANYTQLVLSIPELTSLRSDVASINYSTSGPPRLRTREVSFRNRNGKAVLSLRLSYTTERGRYVRVTVWSPHCILNETGEELMFSSNISEQLVASYPVPMPFTPSGGTRVRTRDTAWSPFLPMEPTAEPIQVRLSGQRPRDLLLLVYPMQGDCDTDESLCMKFLPNYVLRNCDKARALEYRLGDTEQVCELAPATSVDVHFPDPKRRAVQLRHAGYCWIEISLEFVDEYPVVMYPEGDGLPHFSSIEMKLVDQTLVVSYGEDEGNPPFIVENWTRRDVFMQQKESKHSVCIPAMSSIPFAWDVPSVKRCIVMFGETLTLLRAGEQKLLCGNTIGVTLSFRGSQRVIEIRKITGPEPPSQVVASYEFSLHSVGVSLLDSAPVEILFVTLERPSCAVEVREKEVSVKFRTDFQIDNTLRDAVSPVILRHGRQAGPGLALDLDLYRSKLTAPSVHVLSLTVQPVVVQLEEATVDHLLRTKALVEQSLKSVRALSPSPSPPTPSSQPQTSTNRINIETILISPLEIDLTFNTTAGFRGNTAMRWLKPVLGLQDAHIVFYGLYAENVRGTRASVLYRVRHHYTSQWARQVVKLFFSSEFSGNPVGMFRDIKGGFEQLNEPGHGLGGVFGHTVAGLSNAAGALTSTFGSTLHQISGNDDFARSHKPTGIGSGLASGAESLAKGLLRGLTGPVVQPIQQFKKDGATGIATGVLSGLVGIVAEPIAGAFDAMSMTAKGLRNEIVGQDYAQRTRQPRHIGADRVLKPYSAEWAFVQSVLWKISRSGNPLERYVMHLMPAKEPNAKELFVVVVQTTETIASILFTPKTGEARLEGRVLRKDLPRLGLTDALRELKYARWDDETRAMVTKLVSEALDLEKRVPRASRALRRLTKLR